MYMDKIESYFGEFDHILRSMSMVNIENAAKMINGSDVTMFCGNGGSYATASHMAGDILMNTPIKGNTIAMGDNLVSFSACSNDVCYAEVFEVELISKHKLVQILRDTQALIDLIRSGNFPPREIEECQRFWIESVW